MGSLLSVLIGAPAWTQAAGTISDIVVAAGVVIAGAFSYLKFFKGRTLRPRCSINIDAQLHQIDGSAIYRISVSVRNEGQVALLFLSEAPQLIKVAQANNAVWAEARALKTSLRWEDDRVQVTVRGLNASDGEVLNKISGKPTRKWWHRPPFALLRRDWLLSYLDGDLLEPGEQWMRGVIVPVESDTVVCLIRVEVHACRHYAARHGLLHHTRCCRDDEGHIAWNRELYVLPSESEK